MKTKRAFTLFEVLLALGIFGIAVVGMMAALNGTLDSAREARREQLVRQAIENRLAELEGGDIREGERVTGEKSPAITITESVRREPVHSGRERLEGFWRIRVTAAWQDRGEWRSEEASVLRYRP